MNKNLSPKQKALYDRLRDRGRYQGLPRGALFWKEVLDATSGHGIRPYRRPGGGWLEHEEFLSSVPVLLRNRRDGFPPDEVAQMLDLEDGDQELYEKLQQDAYSKPVEECSHRVEETVPGSSSSLRGNMVVFEKPEIKEPFYFHSSKDVYEKMKGYQKADREMFTLLFLNAHNAVINIETHTVGSVDGSAVYATQVFRSALLHNASSLICMHNHPSGDPEPSISDREITKRLALCARMLELKFLDHIVLGDNGYFSFTDAGLMVDYDQFAKERLDN